MPRRSPTPRDSISLLRAIIRTLALLLTIVGLNAPPITKLQHVRDLSTALRVFMRSIGPRLLVMQAVILVGYRLHAGGFGWWDLLIVVAVAIAWPLQEWVAHRFLLHMQPLKIGAREWMPAFARAHQAHHREPAELEFVLLPQRVLLLAIPLHVGAWWLLMPDPRLALTGAAAYGTAAAIYEWVHYFVHTGVRPKTAWMRRVRRNHRWHHFKNERYWLSFTVPQLDAWLGTDPDPKSVELSGTARGLGADPDP